MSLYSKGPYKNLHIYLIYLCFHGGHLTDKCIKEIEKNSINFLKNSNK